MSEEYMLNEERESDRAHASDDENEERKNEEIILNKINEWKIKRRNAQEGSDREVFCNRRIFDFKEKLKREIFEEEITKEIKPLSEKKICIGNITLGKISELPYYVYPSKDVEELLKNLKEELKEVLPEIYSVPNQIDKIFKKHIGEELPV